MLAMSESRAEMGRICTGRSNPTSNGPSTVEPPSSCSIFVEMAAEWPAGMTSTLAGPESRQEGAGAMAGGGGATDAPPVEDAHRILHACRTLPERIAERRIGEQRHARLEAEPPRHARRLRGDIGQLLGGRHVVHRSVGNQHRAAAAEGDGHADDAV